MKFKFGCPALSNLKGTAHIRRRARSDGAESVLLPLGHSLARRALRLPLADSEGLGP